MTWTYFYPGKDLTPWLSFRCHQKVMRMLMSVQNFDKFPLNKTPKGGITLFVPLISCMVTAFFNNAMFMEDTNIQTILAANILFFFFIKIKSKISLCDFSMRLSILWRIMKIKEGG